MTSSESLGKSSRKLGSGEFMRLRLGDGLSFFLMIFFCHSFRQIVEAEICWLTARCVVNAFRQNWQCFFDILGLGGMARCTMVTNKAIRNTAFANLGSQRLFTG
jgi:hypothetical protein